MTDDSGIKLLTTEKKMPKTAAVYLLYTAAAFAAPVPRYDVTYLEVACPIELPKGVEMHPFAFRSHTHKVFDFSQTEISKK